MKQELARHRTLQVKQMPGLDGWAIITAISHDRGSHGRERGTIGIEWTGRRRCILAMVLLAVIAVAIVGRGSVVQWSGREILPHHQANSYQPTISRRS